MKRKLNKNIHLAVTVLILFAATVFTSCSKGDDETKDSDVLTGKWTCLSVTGTVGYSTDLGNSLAAAINKDITKFNLTNVVDLNFDPSIGKVAIQNMGTFFGQFDYTLSGNRLLLKQNGYSLNYSINWIGDDFTIDASGTDLAMVAAWAIGNAVLKTNGYGGMNDAGVEVTQYDLIMRFQKQQ